MKHTSSDWLFKEKHSGPVCEICGKPSLILMPVSKTDERISCGVCVFSMGNYILSMLSEEVEDN